MTRLGIVVAFVAYFATPTLAQHVTRSDLKSGLVFTISGPDHKSQSRIEPGVGLTLAAGEAAHPQAGECTTFLWQGYINILQAGKYQFDATVAGAVDVTVGQTNVLSGSVKGTAAARITGPEIHLPAGFQPFEVKLGRIGPVVRIELFWSGPGFRKEPVPYFFFGHLPKARPEHIAADLERDHGRFLFEELSCTRCHKSITARFTERSGPNLTDIGRRVFPGWLDAWLADPHRLRPDTTMPRLFSDDATGTAERYAVLTYLVSLSAPLRESSKQISAGELQRSLVNGQRLFITTGCAACHPDPTVATRRDSDPDAEPPAPLKSEDSAYSIGTAGPKSGYRLGALGSKSRPDVLARFLENPLATNPHGRMPGMALSGSEARDLALFLYRHADESIPRSMPPPPRTKPETLARKANQSIVERWRFARLATGEQWKTLGQKLYLSKGCVNCHAVEVSGKAIEVRGSMPQVSECDPTAGCLAASPDAGRVPVYQLEAGQKSALAAFLKGGLTRPDQPAPTYQAKVALRRYNCLACHHRDGEGGLEPELADRMRLLEKAENADDVLPPRLTGAGHKLQSEWFQQVLTQAGRARPWMTLRMPQYGPHNVDFLVDAVPKLEGTVAEQKIARVPVTAAQVETGRLLAGKNGHGCISCHDISGVTSGGTRGPDLALTSQRVRSEWYSRWMHQPQRVAPGTRMPQVAIDGKALLTDVFAGDADRQFEALWVYFSLGPGLPLPAGLEPPKGVVVTIKDRPELLRTFLPDAGSKAIAVGYPGGVSVAFDAAQCRLGYAWNGNFLDASPVWNNRGGNPARLLGSKFWTAPGGFPWALSDGPTLPDFVRRMTDPAYGAPLPDDRFHAGPRLVHFDGYTLDSSGSPTFRYSLLDRRGQPQLAVTETPEPLPVTVASGVRRRLTVESSVRGTPWFLAGTSRTAPRIHGPQGVTTITPRLGGVEVPVSKARVVLPQDGERAVVLELTEAPVGSAWRFLQNPGSGWLVLLRLPECSADGGVRLALSIWGLPRDDEQLLRGLK